MEIGDEVRVIDRGDINFRQRGTIECFDDEPNGDGIIAVHVKFKWVVCWYYPSQLKLLKENKK